MGLTKLNSNKLQEIPNCNCTTDEVCVWKGKLGVQNAIIKLTIPKFSGLGLCGSVQSGKCGDEK